MFDWFENIRQKPRSTKSTIALVLSAVITLTFAIPWFYYGYIYNEPQNVVQKNSPTTDVTATIIEPVGEFISQIKEKTSAVFKGVFSQSDEYLKQE